MDVFLYTIDGILESFDRPQTEIYTECTIFLFFFFFVFLFPLAVNNASKECCYLLLKVRSKKRLCGEETPANCC